MVADIVSQYHLPLHEVHSWQWTKLQYTHKQVLRARWNAYVQEVEATREGAGRALAASFGAKNIPPMPTFEDMHLDPWAERVKTTETEWGAFRPKPTTE